MAKFSGIYNSHLHVCQKKKIRKDTQHKCQRCKQKLLGKHHVHVFVIIISLLFLFICLHIYVYLLGCCVAFDKKKEKKNDFLALILSIKYKYIYTYLHHFLSLRPILAILDLSHIKNVLNQIKRREFLLYFSKKMEKIE